MAQELDTWLTDNWSAVREERGLSWAGLADELAKNSGTESLEAWARGQETAEDKSTPKPTPAKRENAVTDGLERA